MIQEQEDKEKVGPPDNRLSAFLLPTAIFECARLAIRMLERDIRPFASSPELESGLLEL